MIQNAEDAGATDVTFLFDQHSHGTEKLHQESLAIHQVTHCLFYLSTIQEHVNFLNKIFTNRYIFNCVYVVLLVVL